MDTKQVVAALKIQPLSEEEKTRRHILGRLCGPIATCTESTRNGRKYNRQLWEKALNDEIFKEKISYKSLLLEFSHPTDREETDPLKACACIPELPKIIDGDLYAYVDILDTPSGKILKTLIDYGFVPGISSRGSGDIMANDEVDPETFFLETWDIVQLPAVKKARLSVCESLDPRQKGLRAALSESLSKASEEDKEIMKETLENLDIKLDEDAGVTPVSETDPLYKFYPDGIPAETPVAADPTEDENVPLVADAMGDDIEAPEKTVLKEDADEEEAEDAEEETTEEDDTEETEEVSEEESDEEVETDEESEVLTVADIIEDFKTLGEDSVIEFAPVEIDGVTYDTKVVVQEQEDGKVVLGVNCTPIENNEDIESTEELPAEENPSADIVIDASSDDDEITVEIDSTEEPAVDDGDDEVMESFKELVRQKGLLESEVKALKKAQAVSNAEASALKEQLDQYKTGFARTSELAGQATKAKKEVADLTEQLAQKESQINSLEKSLANAKKTSLDESYKANDKKINSLNEQLATVSANAKKTAQELNGQLDQYKARLKESVEQAKQYKNKFTAVLNKYIESRAKMLGVQPSEITKRLKESYTLNDIDTICDSLLSNSVGVGKLPFAQKQVKAKINESATPRGFADPYDNDDDLSDLYSLAGLQYKK